MLFAKMRRLVSSGGRLSCLRSSSQAQLRRRLQAISNHIPHSDKLSPPPALGTGDWRLLGVPLPD